MKKTNSTLNARNFALAGGILWGAAMLIFTLIATGTGYAKTFLQLFSSLYPGYTISIMGSFVGLIYGFIDAFIGLYLFAWLYNWLGEK